MQKNESNRPSVFACLLWTSCLLASCLAVSAVCFVSLSHWCILYHLSLTLCLIVSAMLFLSLPIRLLGTICLLSHQSLRGILSLMVFASCLTISAVEFCLLCFLLSLSCLTCLPVSYLSSDGPWVGQRSGLLTCRRSDPAHTPPAQSELGGAWPADFGKSAPAPSRGRVGTPPLG